MIRAPRVFWLMMAGLVLAGAGSCMSRPGFLEPDEAPPSAYGAFLAARYAGSSREASEAARLYAEALEQEPNSAVISENAFLSALVAGDFARADRAAMASRRNAEDEARLAGIYLMAGALADRREIRSVEGRAIAGPFAEVVRQMIEDWGRIQREGADEVARERAAATRSARRYATYWFVHDALVFEAAGRVGEAEEAYRNAIGSLQLNAFTTRMFGEFLERQGRRDDAIRFYSRQLERTPGAYDLRVALARVEAGRRAPRAPHPAEAAARAVFAPAAVFANTSRSEYAALYLRIVQRLDPQFHRNSYYLAGVLERLSLFEAAEGVYVEIAGGAFAEAAAVDRAWLRFRSGDRTGGEMLAEEANTRFESQNAQLLLADIYRVTQRCEQAAPIYARAAAERADGIGGDQDWRFAFFEGVCRQIGGDWPAAEALFLRALEIDPEQPRVLNHLGYNWIVLNLNVERGFELVSEAARLSPENGSIIDSLGWGYFKQGRFDEAVAHLEQAVALSPYNPTINWHLGDAYYRSGRQREAQFQWRRALSLQPEERERSLIETRLEAGLDAAPADLE
ncbi:MAG: tetratricopeptide repeat protein [Pseudomonadota bacterium]